MSGAGAPTVSVDGSGSRVTVVAASWHTEVMDGLSAGARRALAAANVSHVSVVRVPGSFESPVAAARAVEHGADAVVASGVVIRGGTPHFEYVCQAATSGSTDVSVRTGVPVGFGVSTCDDEQQASDRAGSEGSREDKGAEAAEAAVATVPVKTFESSFAESSEKATTRPAGSGTVAESDAGVHAIGKKVVEEAAEVWMAAEYEGDVKTAEEISQLLYHSQVLMSAKGSSSQDVYEHLAARPSLVPAVPLFSPDPSNEGPVMSRIAVPNKGSSSEPAVEMSREAGYRQRRDPRESVSADPDNDAEFFFSRPRDIAVYVGSGTVDVGVTGRDSSSDSGADAVEHMQLGFGGSTFRYAAPAGTITSLEQVQGSRVATSYEVLVEGHSRAHGVDATVVHSDGAVESAVQLGVADVVADVVSTGTTSRGAGSEVFGDPISVSEAVSIRPRKVAEADVPAGVEVSSRRSQGVSTAHEYVLMDYDVPVSLVDRAVAITPGSESPTVSPSHDRDWAAVRAMVRRDRTNQVMDASYDVGARAILVTRIHASRL
ncbi:hypothetical protein OY671_002312 [Metschnikowia pulcherrima]|nr:hypothetical protein OY671_002312 [Metschnikowia pulcherrima]